jgi:hypothetical protein
MAKKTKYFFLQMMQMDTALLPLIKIFIKHPIHHLLKQLLFVGAKKYEIKQILIMANMLAF